MSVRLLIVALGIQLLLGAGFIYAATQDFGPLGDDDDGGRPARAAGTTAPNRFDADRAFAELRAQVEMGPRPAGSEASRRLAVRLRTLLPHGRFEAVPGGLRNVVGRLPGRRPAILVAAHYDTKDIDGFVGANDGASGTASVVELARGLRRGHTRRHREIRFVLFDGEETPRGTPDERFYEEGLRGSKEYVRRHRARVGSLVLLDFVGDKELTLPREGGSDARLWARLRASARRVGTSAHFPPRPVGEILDDHTPFARVGIPAIDLIDFDFPCWHQTCDDMTAVSAESLDAAGEAVYDLVSRLRRQPPPR